MRAQLRTALADDAVRVVVLDHTGRVFCSGMDLTEAVGGAAGDQGARAARAAGDRVALAQAGGRRPPRAGGLGLAAACDVVVAAASATLALSEVRLGIVPAVISTVVLPRMLPHTAHRLMLTGEVFDAAAAAAGGLVALCVPDDEVDDAVAGQVAALAAGAPAALAETKRLLRAGGLRGSAEELLELSARFFASEEGQEGMRAFAERRPPRWADAGG